MRRLFYLGLVLSAGGLVACADTPPTGRPSFGSGGAGGGGGGGGAGGAGGSTGGGGMGGGVPADGSADGSLDSSAGGNGGNDAGVDGPAVGGAGGGGGTGGSGAAGSPQVAPPAAIGLVALNSDFTMTSLSILSTEGGLLHADCVDSSTGSGGGSSRTISGDAVLPSQPQLGGKIVLIDRVSGVLDFVDPVACLISRQVAVVGGGKTNPTDLVILSDAKAYVTRPGQNPAATDPMLAGNDILIIDPDTGTPTGQIDLDAFVSTVPGASVLAAPDRAVIADGRVAVSLNEADASSGTYGEGKVVFIDPATDQVVAAVALTGLHNCEGLTYLEPTKTLLVSCGGTLGAQDAPVESGIAVVDLAGSAPILVRSISAVAFDDRPLTTSAVVVQPPTGGGTRGFAVTSDPNGIGPDVLFTFDYVLGTSAKIATGDPQALGRAAGEPGLLLVPDASVSLPHIRLYDVSGSPQATTGFTSDPVTGLPPRQVAAY